MVKSWTLRLPSQSTLIDFYIEYCRLASKKVHCRIIHIRNNLFLSNYVLPCLHVFSFLTSAGRPLDQLCLRQRITSLGLLNGLEPEAESGEPERRPRSWASFALTIFFIRGLAAEIWSSEIGDFWAKVKRLTFLECAMIWPVQPGRDSTGVFSHISWLRRCCSYSATERGTSNTSGEAELPARTEKNQPLLDFASPNSKKRWTFIEVLNFSWRA